MIRFLLSGMIFLSGCANVFTSSANRGSNEALMFSAQEAANVGDWPTAISKINSMSSTYQARRDVQLLLSTAYVGRCGLDAMNVVYALINGSGTPMVKLLTQFPGRTTGNASDCVTAQTLLSAIWSTDGIASLTDREKFLVVLVGLSTITAISSKIGDTNANGVIDAGFAPCTNGAGAGELPSNDATNKIDAIRIAFSIQNIWTALNAMSSSAQAVTAMKSAFQVACQYLATATTGGAAAGDYDVCGYTTDFGTTTARIRNAARTFVSEGVAIGFDRPATGSNLAATLAACLPE